MYLERKYVCVLHIQLLHLCTLKLSFNESIVMELIIFLVSFMFKNRFLFMLERPTQAKECYLEALTIQPNHINANTNMGHYYRLHNRWKEAVNHFTIASNRSPNDPSLYYYLGQMYMKLGDKQVFTTSFCLFPCIFFLIHAT